MLLKVVILSALLGLCQAKASGRAFSIFNVITFANEPCVSDSSSSSSSTGYRNGTCYTAEECTEKGGKAAGNCASGFGTCCLFSYDECGKEVSHNNTYIRNEGFPSAVTSSSSCIYKVKKCADDICTLRLDFDTFSLLGGTTSDGLSDNEFECQDTFDVTGLTTAQKIPTICGMNNGQHIYIDLGMSPSSTANLNFAFSDAVGSRRFEIRVSQIGCHDIMRPRQGCLQYFTGTVGRITSFNWEANLHHLNDQSYTVCIRQEEGFCCNLYKQCADESSFTLDDDEDDSGSDPDARAGTSCREDYIEIEGSSGVCHGRTFQTRYCGDRLSAEYNGDVASPICDCTYPFEIGVNTNAGVDENGDPLVDDESDKNRGLCLEYRQKPCGVM